MTQAFSSKSIMLVILFLTAVPTLYLANAIRRAYNFDQTLHPKKEPLTDDMKAIALLLIKDLKNVEFTTQDGIKLKGWYAAPTGGKHKAVILVHGGFGNRFQMLADAAALHEDGIGVLLYDSRASGESDGSLMTWGDKEQLDLEAAVDYLITQQGQHPWNIGALGFSIGATTVTMVAAKDPRVKAVLVNALWPALEREIDYKMRKGNAVDTWFTMLGFRLMGVDVQSTKPIEAIGKISPRPLMLIGGGQDEDTPPAVYEEVYRAAKQPKELHFVEDAGHGNYVAKGGQDYLNKVVAFFNTSL